MNRGSLGGTKRHERRRGASMRPRFMNRGSATAREVATAPGRRFNEAPIHESGK